VLLWLQKERKLQREYLQEQELQEALLRKKEAITERKAEELNSSET